MKLPKNVWSNKFLTCFAENLIFYKMEKVTMESTVLDHGINREEMVNKVEIVRTLGESDTFFRFVIMRKGKS